jgi:hypothetical protein
MGYKTMFFLKDIQDGKPGPKDPTYTGLDVCTLETVAPASDNERKPVCCGLPLNPRRRGEWRASPSRYRRSSQ